MFSHLLRRVLNIAIFMKNALITSNGHAPYQAVFGRQPAMLPSLKSGYTGPVHDNMARPETNVRHQSRLREIAAQSITEAPSEVKLERAYRHKSIPAGELRGYQTGGLVDMRFPASNKDTPGFRGPVKIVSVQQDEGNATVRCQGRSLD